MNEKKSYMEMFENYKKTFHKKDWIDQYFEKQDIRSVARKEAEKATKQYLNDNKARIEIDEKSISAAIDDIMRYFK